MFSRVKLEEGTILKSFVDSTRQMDPHGRGKELEKCNQIANVHSEVAGEGQTAPPDPEVKNFNHFVTFVHKEGHLYELNAEREFPINYGPTTPENFLKVNSTHDKPDNFNENIN